jgi:hypothetical protein
MWLISEENAPRKQDFLFSNSNAGNQGEFPWSIENNPEFVLIIGLTADQIHYL